MKDINLTDPYGSKKIRMCEKHVRQYRSHLDAASRGGTSYTLVSTNKRGCEICKREKSEKTSY